ncbi:MAG: pilus assembly protein [Microlunatus sp.]|nr:pilus assembly protein [Microlunatus sp.]
MITRLFGASTPRRDERGSASVELVIVVPVLVIMLGLLIAGGRLWFARATVVEASQSAARAASLERSAGTAASAGQAAAARVLRTEGLDCGGLDVSVDTSAFGVPVGTPATIRSTVRCTVRFADLSLPGMPGSITVESAGASALDTYRARS